MLARKPVAHPIGDARLKLLEARILAPDALSGDKPDARRYFRYNAAWRGNSNLGHDYPWPYPAGGWNLSNPDHRQKAEALKNLLEYLKTL